MSSFEEFVSIFPEVTLPVILQDETAHVFSQANGMIPDEMVRQYILPFEETEADELTEFVPCFRIPATHDFYALVFWRASLMHYTFTLLCMDKKGGFIDRKILAGTFYNENALVQSLATIEEDWEILVVSGKSSQGQIYEAASSNSFKLELLPEGHIIDLS